MNYYDSPTHPNPYGVRIVKTVRFIGRSLINCHNFPAVYPKVAVQIATSIKGAFKNKTTNSYLSQKLLESVVKNADMAFWYWYWQKSAVIASEVTFELCWYSRPKRIFQPSVSPRTCFIHSQKKRLPKQYPFFQKAAFAIKGWKLHPF